MKCTLILTLALLLLGGCGGSSSDTNNPGASADQIIAEEDLASIAGATFVSVEPLNADGTPATPNRTVSFTADTVTRSQDNVTEVGTFLITEESGAIANFDSSSINFIIDDDTIIWDSLTYQRVATSLFDSQEDLTVFLDGSTFNTVDQFDLGENASGARAMGQWSARFDGVRILWAVQDTLRPGTYSRIDHSSFKITFGSDERTVFVLSNDQLVIDSIVYQREARNKIGTQKSLVALLDGASYQSVRQLPIGENTAGTQVHGYWYLDFLADTFSWAHHDVSQAGSYSYRSDRSFTAVLENISYLIEIDGNDIIWQGERYTKQ